MRLGLAIRPGVFSAKEALSVAENAGGYAYFFIPDVSGSVDPLVLALAITTRRSDCSAGSGVLRAFEQDERLLAREVSTMNEISGKRIFVGVGAGGAGGKGVAEKLAKFIRELKPKTPGTPFYAAALREGMARAVSGVADGIILNFSTYEHAASMSKAFKRSKGGLVFSYLKVFISEANDIAERMAVEEVLKYNSYPHYNALFESEGVSEILSSIIAGDRSALRRLEEAGVLLVNPTVDDLSNAVREFNRNGVDVVVVYPYFEPGAGLGFKLKTVQSFMA